MGWDAKSKINSCMNIRNYEENNGLQLSLLWP